MKTSMRSLQNQRPIISFRMLFIVLLLISCSREKEDPCCVFSEIGAGAEIKSGEGGLQVDGTTTAYFYVFDKSGNQVNYQSLNKTLSLPPGEYMVKVNNTSHPVKVEGGVLAKCSTGTVKVNGTTSDYYYVLDSAANQLAYNTLEKSSSLFPSRVLVKVNNSVTRAEIKLNQVTEITTGTMVVRGSTSEYYYVLDQTGNQLNYNTLEKPLAFVPGNYTVKVNNTTTKREVSAGQITEIATGNVQVNGVTSEYYYVLDTLGNQLNYQTMNKALAVLPGTVKVKVNNTEVTTRIAKGETNNLATGSITVPGKSADQYFYVLDKNGVQLNYNSLNKPLAFFPGDYTVKVGEKTKNFTIKENELVRVAGL